MSLILDDTEEQSTVRELLNAILTEIKILNSYISEASGDEIKEDDLDDD